MVYRLSWIAGIAGIVFALLRLERLLRSSIEGLPWEIVLIAAAILGGAITSAAISYRLSSWVAVAINLVAMVFAVVRIAVPGTTWFVFPTLQSFSELRFELEFARDVIRTGVAPVIPLSGVIAVLAVVFWALGALLAWSMLRDRPYVGALAPLVVYLQFATMDRVPSGGWTIAFLVILALSLVAVAFDMRRRGTGLLTSGSSRLAVVRTVPTLAGLTLAAILLVTAIGTNAVAGLIPRSGLLAWRSSSGLTGEYYGSVSYNPFVGIQQDLVSQTNVPVFVAEIDGDVDPSDVYWRLLTLDTYNGDRWFADNPEVTSPEELAVFETPGSSFDGPTGTITQNITILALQMPWLPAAYAPQEMEAPNRAVDRGFRVKEDDASIYFDALTYRGMAYSVVSEIPQPDLDVLSRDADGAISQIFGAAADEGDFESSTEAFEMPEPRELEDEERFLTLPEELSPAIGALAIEQTRGLSTDFEKGIALENFFRTPGTFRYDTDIEPGHGAENLADWLLVEDSPNYRTGYCENFSTAMAVMARELGIPSRVVLGFTPGQVLDDGRVVVRDRNAHAWVELWMPTQGWVRFDPTPRGDGVNPSTIEDLPFDVAAYLEIPEPDSAIFEPNDSGGPILPFIDEELRDIPRFAGGGADDTIPAPSIPSWVFLGAGSLVLLFGLLPAVKWLRRRRRLARLERGDISAAWLEIVDRLDDLGDGPDPTLTPAEFAGSFDTAMKPLAEAYGSSLYGPPGEPDHKTVMIASRSFDDTEDRIPGRYSIWHRLGSRYRLRSVTPAWWTRWRNRKM